MKRSGIPKPTVKRLAVYYRCLNKFKENNLDKTSSKELADSLSIKASQIRKDLSYFGEFGKRGVGYDIDSLSYRLKDILGLNKPWNIAVVGCGNLGAAIANYSGMEKNGFKIVAAFDVDSKKLGKMIIPGVNVSHIDNMKELIKNNKIEIVILTAPVSVAQEITNKLIDSGVHGILNFTPTSLNVPTGVAVEDVDFVISMKSLTFEISSKNEEL